VLDLDATDLPLHGYQEQRFFHGFYNHYCYLPLYIVCGDHLLGVRLRPSNIDASAGSLEEIGRIVQQIRQAWPKTRIILRADSGFCRDRLSRVKPEGWFIARCQDSRPRIGVSSAFATQPA
jgi:Transposase DDE domain group 1